jgi:hypothetical protein
MECINKSQSLTQQQSYNEIKIAFDIVSKGVKLNIYQEGLYNLNRSETQLKIENFTYKTLTEQNMPPELF